MILVFLSQLPCILKVWKMTQSRPPPLLSVEFSALLLFEDVPNIYNISAKPVALNYQTKWWWLEEMMKMMYLCPLSRCMIQVDRWSNFPI